MNYKLLFILSAYFVVESYPVIVKMDDYKTVYREWRSRDLAQTKNEVYKRDVSGPVSNVGKQISTFVSVVNSAILGEAVVQNLTSFGEIGVNLMLMQNMPAGEDWISSVDPNDIVMEKSEDLRKILEDGFDKELSIDALKNVMIIEEGISSLDALSDAYAKIQNITAIYPNSSDFNFSTAITTLNYLSSLSKSLPVIKSLHNDFKPLEYLKTGVEIIKNYSQIDVNEMEKSFKSCKTSISSGECTSGFAVLRSLSSEKDLIENIETVAAILDLIHYSDGAKLVGWLMKQKNKIVFIYENLSKVQHLIGTDVDYGSLKGKFSNMLSSIDKLKVDESKLKPYSGTFEIFRTVSEAVDKMHNTYQSKSQKKTKKDNEHSTNIFDSFRGLPEGIITLNELPKQSRLPPDEYRNSKIAERSKLIEEFTAQRLDFLKFSKGVKSVQFISSIIKNIESYSGHIPDSKSCEKSLKGVLEDSAILASIGNISDGINALKNITAQIENLTLTKIGGFYTAVQLFEPSFDKKAFKNMFNSLARVLKSAKKVDDLMNTNGKADEVIFTELIDTFKVFSNITISNKDQLLVPTTEDIENMKTMINDVFSSDLNMTTEKLHVETVGNGFKIAQAAHEKIEKIVAKKSEHSQFAPSLTKLEELKNGLSTRPNQNEINDLEPFMTVLNSLKPLKFTSELKTEKKSPHITVLMKGTPYGADILGSISKRVDDYLGLIKGISSIQDFETVETTIKGLLVGVDAIQFVDAKDKLSAYDIFYESKVIEERMRKLEEFIHVAQRKMKDGGLKAIIDKKVNSSLAHSFLSRLGKLDPISMPRLGHDILWILKGLEFALDCDQMLKDPRCREQPAKKVERSESTKQGFWKSLLWYHYCILVGFIFLCLFGAVILAYKCYEISRPRAEQDQSLLHSGRQYTYVQDGKLFVVKNTSDKDKSAEQKNKKGDDKNNKNEQLDEKGNPSPGNVQSNQRIRAANLELPNASPNPGEAGDSPDLATARVDGWELMKQRLLAEGPVATEPDLDSEADFGPRTERTIRGRGI